MKLALVTISPVIYLVVAAFAWPQILLQCGIGPDSPAACNVHADRQVGIFVVAASAGHLLLGIVYWRHPPTKVQ